MEDINWIIGAFVLATIAMVVWCGSNYWRAMKYENEVKMWLSQNDCDDWDEDIVYDYYERGESSWNAAQAIEQKEKESE